MRAVDLLSRHWADRRVYATIDLGNQSRVPLELDLSVQGCVDLFARPLTRFPDAGTLRLFAELARDATGIVDVGAHAGVFTYVGLAHAPQARIIAYEPSPRVATVIERNVARNGWQARVNVRREGVSAVAGTLTLYILPIDSETTLEAGRARQHRIEDRITIPVIALDDALESLALSPEQTLVKIDVEGHEMRVLDGLDRTLRRRGRRPTMIIEFLGKAIQEEHVIERVISCDLHVYYIAGTVLVPLRSALDLAPVHRLDQWNFLVTDRPSDAIRRVAAAAGITFREPASHPLALDGVRAPGATGPSP